MSENYRVYNFSDKRFSRMSAISQAATKKIGRTYGIGYSHSHGNQGNRLAYHNLGHTQRVRKGTAAMAAAFGLTQADRVIADVAASAHDIVQLKPRGVMERESADWLVYMLHSSDTTPESIETGELAVLGTEPVFDGGMIVDQVVSQQSYPSKVAAKVALSVACADLGELHSASGPLAGHKIYQELQVGSDATAPDLEKLLPYQAGQVELVESYRYPHELGGLVLGTLRSEVATYTRQVLDQLERGALDGWQQLIDQDVAFMLQHS